MQVLDFLFGPQNGGLGGADPTLGGLNGGLRGLNACGSRFDSGGSSADRCAGRCGAGFRSKAAFAQARGGIRVDLGCCQTGLCLGNPGTRGGQLGFGFGQARLRLQQSRLGLRQRGGACAGLDLAQQLPLIDKCPGADRLGNDPARCFRAHFDLAGRFRAPAQQHGRIDLFRYRAAYDHGYGASRKRHRAFFLGNNDVRGVFGSRFGNNIFGDIPEAAGKLDHPVAFHHHSVNHGADENCRYNGKNTHLSPLVASPISRTLHLGTCPLIQPTNTLNQSV